MKKIKLDSVFENEYIAIGVVCSENDYRVSWLINHHLNFKLSRVEDHIIESKAGIELAFPLYYYVEHDEVSRYVLVGNKTEEGSLLPEYRNMDYIIFIYAEDCLGDAEKLLKKIKHIPSFLLAVQIDQSNIKSEENIQFDIL